MLNQPRRLESSVVRMTDHSEAVVGLDGTSVLTELAEFLGVTGNAGAPIQSLSNPRYNADQELYEA